MHVGARCEGACLFDSAVEIGAVRFMIPGDINHRMIRDAFKQPGDATFHAWNQITSNDQHVVMRPIANSGKIPAAGKLHMQV